MPQIRRKVAAVVFTVALGLTACGDGSSGGAGGEDKPGAKTEDNGGGY